MKNTHRLFALSLAVFLTASGAWAQQAAPNAPNPAKPAAIRTRLGSNTSGRVTLTDGSRSVRRTARELGIYPTVNKAALKDALARIAPKFKQAAVDARPYVYKGQVRINPGSYSRALNVATTAEKLAQAAASGLPKTFRVALDKKPPTLTADRLRGINGVIGTITTRASNVAGRNKNVQLGANLIDGIYLSPKEEFSLNKTVGPRVKARGFREAIIFVDAEKVQGVGGGISQVTGTTFAAAMRAGFTPVEANLHSRTVPYLPPGYDATVAWPDKDMRFINNTGYPAFIAMGFRNQQLTCTIYGHKVPGRRVVLKNAVQRLGPGKVNAQLYRIIKQNGQVISKERLTNHQYRWDPTKKGVQQ